MSESHLVEEEAMAGGNSLIVLPGCNSVAAVAAVMALPQPLCDTGQGKKEGVGGSCRCVTPIPGM